MVDSGLGDAPRNAGGRRERVPASGSGGAIDEELDCRCHAVRGQNTIERLARPFNLQQAS